MRARALHRRCSAVDHGLELAAALRARKSHPASRVIARRGQFCINEAVAYAKAHTWGKPLSRNQAIQFPLVELPHRSRDASTNHPVHRMVTRPPAPHGGHHLIAPRSPIGVLGERHSHLVAMHNYRANRFACDAADQAMQMCGGIGYAACRLGTSTAPSPLQDHREGSEEVRSARSP